MPRFVLTFVLLLTWLTPASAQRLQHTKKGRTQHSPQATKPGEPLQFVLWEPQSDLRKRAGEPRQYFVPAIQKLIKPSELRYYSDNYQKVDDVFYRHTATGEVRILVAYAQDESQGHLHPEVRVEKVHF